MVITDGEEYHIQYHQAHHVLTHRRYPSSTTPAIKESPNRAQLLLHSQENLPFMNDDHHHATNSHIQGKSNIAYRSTARAHLHRASNGSSSATTHGRTPTIVSSMAISPTVTRKHSIQQRKRFMMSRKELKNRFFYPIGSNNVKRVRSRRGKYRNRAELDASMSYIDFNDPSLSKDLCFNQYVMAYDIQGNTDLIRPAPKLRETVKVITVDSQNNYILYSPDPTPGKNSIIADAEQILNEELVKLGNPITLVHHDHNSHDQYQQHNALPTYRIIRPDFHRYDTFPLTEGTQSLIRTRSLPSTFQDDKLQALWNLYLRRVIAARIKWRLTHSSQEYLDKTKRRDSMASSVDTGFFINEQLREQRAFPNAYKSSPSDAGSHSSYQVQRQAPPPPPTHGSDHSTHSALSSMESRSPTRQVMLDSLEQLMAEVTSVASGL